MAEIDASRPVHLIVNPHSGYGGGKHMLGLLRAAARRRGLNLVQYTTRAPADATRYARQIADSASAVVVWGGDGTVNEVANALAGTDVPILPCPVGTENLLAKELRIPRQPDGIMDLLTGGRVISCDVGTINGKGFLLIIGVGFDGEVVRRLVARRTGHISHLSYFWPIWRTFWEHRFPRMRVVADGQEIFDDRAMIFIGNISRYATGLRICRDARFDDGMLDLVIFRCAGRIALIRHAARTMLKYHPSCPDVVYRRFRRATIETDTPVASQVDGDCGPDTPLDISLARDRIRLIVPHGRDEPTDASCTGDTSE